MKRGASWSATTSSAIQIPRMIITTPVIITPFDILCLSCLGLYFYLRGIFLGGE